MNQEPENDRTPMPYPVSPGPLCARRMTDSAGHTWVCVLVPHEGNPTHWMVRENRLGL